MKINIPCRDCGCQFFEANEISTGKKVNISVCICHDGGGDYEVGILDHATGSIQDEKHQCPEAELETCLSSRFNIDITTIYHECKN